METGAMLARLVAQAENEGATLVTLRALAEEASEAGAERALERLGLNDPAARTDLGELRQLLGAWRDAKRSARNEVIGWMVRIGLALLLMGLAMKLGLLASGVFDGPPARAAFPYLVIGEGQCSDWSSKTWRGREHRVTVKVWDEAGRAARLHAVVGAIEAAVEGLAPDLPHHRIASLILLRSRILRPAGRPWAGSVEYRVRTRER